jgi:hypothetical protein
MTVPSTVTSLESLVAFLEAHAADVRAERLDVTSLPTFGGAPVDALGVYSWDEARLLVDSGGTWEIVARPAAPFASFDVIQADGDKESSFSVIPFDADGAPVDHPVADLEFASEASARAAAQKAIGMRA